MGGESPAKSGNESKTHGQILTGESAGCKVRSAERPVDEIRRPLLPDASRPAKSLNCAARLLGSAQVIGSAGFDTFKISSGGRTISPYRNLTNRHLVDHPK